MEEGHHLEMEKRSLNLSAQGTKQREGRWREGGEPTRTGEIQRTKDTVLGEGDVTPKCMKKFSQKKSKKKGENPLKGEGTWTAEVRKRGTAGKGSQPLS